MDFHSFLITDAGAKVYAHIIMLNPAPNVIICPNCGDGQKVVDHESGELICTSCGYVIHERVGDESQEWSVLAREPESKMRASRTSLAKSGMGLSTIIGRPDRSAGSGLDAAVRATGPTPLARALVACAAGRTPAGALAAGGPTTVLRVRRLGGRGNSIVLAMTGYLAAAAVLVIPTVALAVPWLTELHRLFIA